MNHVGRSTFHAEHHVFGEFSLSLESEVDFWSEARRCGIMLRTVQHASTGHAKCILGHGKVIMGRAECALFTSDFDLEIGIIELDGELGWEDRLRRRGDAAVFTDFFLV